MCDPHIWRHWLSIPGGLGSWWLRVDIGPDLDWALPPNAKRGGHHNKLVSVETLWNVNRGYAK